MTTDEDNPITSRPGTGSYTVPGLSLEEGTKIAELLQDRLNALNDLALTLKHVHWNVVGPHFIAVHEMLDPQVEEVRAWVDETAERIATLGVSPLGTPGEIVKNRSWSDYSLERATTNEHLGALNVVYDGLIAEHRTAQRAIADVDPVTEDMLIGQIKGLELFQWFIRAHLQNTQGELATAGTRSEDTAAQRAAEAAGE
ncbi:Dps family protein [Pseudactinotalea sp. Z1748]|uniref:Dps family protein n=1 Tax=Pseudactinotalea sp. Z1748 TaxID=3413027 RepID=UPI003C7EA871